MADIPELDHTVSITVAPAVSPIALPSLRYGARTDAGRRRPANEDRYLLQPPAFAVADGMGGHQAGETAAATAIATIAAELAARGQARGGALAAVLRSANAAVRRQASGDAALQGMGTTCTLLVLDDGTAHLAHVGDSRAYLFRDHELRQLTRDHSLVGRLVEEGKIGPAEAARHHARNVITRSLGGAPDLEVDVQAVALQSGDRLLLCTDGLSTMVADDSIAEVLRTEPDADSAVERLVARANEAGGEDNITAVVVDFAVEVSEPREPPTPPRAMGSGRRLALLLALIVIALLLVAAWYLVAIRPVS